MNGPRWLLLIHSLPPEPAYFRVKIRRRLRKLGAIALKNSVYLLEHNDETVEDLHWLAREIRAGGGEAVIAAADVLDGPSDVELDARLRGERGQAGKADTFDLARLGPINGRHWVTRKGIKVDRMASAWLIRHHIDPDATFGFVDEGAMGADDHLRFDMFDGEFTHDGDRCTFEVLVDRFGLGADAALVALGQIVHDLDCKDDRYQRPETAGVAVMADDIVRRTSRDEDRLAAGMDFFASMYRAIQGVPT
jgi:hypothetical protein